jgi:6-phosphofructokinase 1
MMKNEKISMKNFKIPMLGRPKNDSPLIQFTKLFVDENRRISFLRHTNEIGDCISNNKILPSFECAGPRKKIFFNPKQINCGIVTCGGLCPGINNVIRAIVYESYEVYGVKKVYGFRYGYKGIVEENNIVPVLLDTEMVNDIHKKGGTILGSSRGPQDVGKIVDYLNTLGISILFAIGGDGTLRGAADIVTEISKRGLDVSLIGIPKTIDNDISFIEKTFGFETAVEESMRVIQSAHVESKGTENGIGLVKLMGRDSGFIAAQATLANTDVNFCLVPEFQFRLEGKNGVLAMLENRLRRRKHAVIVVAEGAGQNLITKKQRKDASGNIKHEDIGIFLKDKITEYFKQKNFPFSTKYIDPSYVIRSQPANACDSQFCLQMGQNAVHAGMSGRTNMLIGYWNQHYTHVPISLAISERKKIAPESTLWQTTLSVTEQGKHR